MVSGVANEPERPDASRPPSFPSRADQKRAKTSPPIPVMCGSTTFKTAAAATAASKAFPPSWRTLRAAVVAKGWLVAATPFGA